MGSNGDIGPIVGVAFLVVVGTTMVGAILWASIVAIRARRSKKIAPGKVPWQGTTSNVQPVTTRFEQGCVFILLGTTAKPDGSESRFEKSV